MRLKISVQLISETGKVIKEIKREEEIAPKRNAPKWNPSEIYYFCPESPHKIHYYETPETVEKT